MPEEEFELDTVWPDSMDLYESITEEYNSDTQSITEESVTQESISITQSETDESDTQSERGPCCLVD